MDITPPQARYEQVADRLRQMITDGELRPGDPLPSETYLSEQFNLSRPTINKAVRVLVTEGLVLVEHGRGSFVKTRRPLLRLSTERYRRGVDITPPFMAEAAAANVESTVSHDTEKADAPESVAHRLRIEPGAPVSRTRYTFYADGEPVQLSVQWESLTLTRGTAIEVPEQGPVGRDGVVARFDHIGIHVTHVHESVSARMPTPVEARELQVTAGTPVFHITRTHWAGETPVETADITASTDRYAIEHTQQVPLGEPA
ncbi:MAG: GntR family transcriptional regulator [Pseudonocardiaceae bacterium]|nr:GntR family transcriptional regulator [Pseudonocardiaceae bacterium]